MSEDKKVEESKQEQATSSSARQQLFNEPEVVLYNDETGVEKKIMVRRLSAFSLDAAIRPIISLLSCYDEKSKKLDIFSAIATNLPTTFTRDLRVLLGTCVDISANELDKVDLETYGKLMAVFLRINLPEIERFMKTFLGIRTEIEKYVAMMAK